MVSIRLVEIPSPWPPKRIIGVNKGFEYLKITGREVFQLNFSNAKLRKYVCIQNCPFSSVTKEASPPPLFPNSVHVAKPTNVSH